MAPNPTLMKAVEQLGYRVTIGDVAAQAGIEVNRAQQGLLDLASEAGGHLQVTESGEIAYLFPRNFRTILRNKYWQLRLQEWGRKLWRTLFYLIRISFGILLLVSIALIFIAIAIIVIAASSSRGDNDRSDRSFGGGGFVFMPRFWFGPDLFWFFDPYPYRSQRRQPSRSSSPGEPSMNFLEAIFSFLFGDGDPNADLEDRRWHEIGAVIRNNRGAVVAEQIAPYLDGASVTDEDEDYMLPVLSRFDGRPEVSPDGEIIYHFPALQTTARARKPQPVPAYLRESRWQFSHASSGQILLAVGLGSLNLIGAMVLANLLANGTAAAELGGLVAFVQSIFWLLLGYGIAFLTIPLGRYFWIQWRNRQIEARNQQRQEQARLLNQARPDLQQKIAYARQFAAETVVSQENLAYTTEEDLLEQESKQSAQIEAEWQRRLNQADS